MDAMRSESIVNRRELLKYIAVAGFAAAGGALATFYAPWLDADAIAGQSRKPLKREGPRPGRFLELVRCATLAASGHNAQPWLFSIQENEICIHPDYARSLPVVDPDHRELWISLGCALENLVIAARAAGYASEVIYPETEEFIRVRLSKSAFPHEALFDAIALRQNTRSEYEARSVKTADLDFVRNIPLEPGIRLEFITHRSALETVLEYVNQGNLSQFADQAFMNELLGWIRFNKRESVASRDGLDAHCSGRPRVPRWLGRLFVAGQRPRQQADADAKLLRSSFGAVIVSSQTEAKTAWVRAGQVYERMALQMTALNVRSAFLNQPIEVEAVRGEFSKAMGLGRAYPQLLVRFGYAPPLPSSLRRPVEEVLRG
jgi:hypothetical protein